jgi:hypothetical protein
MPHGAALVLIPTSIPLKERVKLVEDMVMPFVSEFPREPYQVPCDSCIDYQVFEDAINVANQQVGVFGVFGRQWLATPRSERPAWRDFPPIVEWQKVAIAAAQADPRSTQRRAACYDCSGTGIRTVDYNVSDGYIEYYAIITKDDRVGELDIYPIANLPLDIEYEGIVTPDNHWHQTASWDDAARPEAQRLLARFHDHLAAVLYVNI